jgi:D-alanyl-lipoteichoic acid acyltransferase DltB (MBOAT superfamily)
LLFQTFEFFLLMTAVLLGVVLIRTRTLQLILLLVASYIFYMSWNPIFILLIVYSTLNDYVVGIGLGRARARGWRIFWLVMSCVTNLGLLAVFKYLNFFLDSASLALGFLGVEAWFPAVEVTLPVGISFYTFQSMSYTIDVFRGHQQTERSLLRFAVYVAFFPQLVAGPILRSTGFLPQLHRNVRLLASDLRAGAHLFLVGLVKKVIVADNVAPLADYVLDAPQGMPSAAIMLAVFAFGIQIYCDFSGYSDMARGLGRMLGYDILLNFNYPYFARSVTDFWRRWHISLSSWLRDYLYIPLGGNRSGTGQTYRNLMLTMGLGGLWHGAAWNFVAWGVYQGLLLALERATGIRARASRGRCHTPSQSAGAMIRTVCACRAVAAWVICQYFVFLGWLLFRVHGASDLLYCVRKYILFDFAFDFANLGLGGVNPFLVLSIIIGFCALHFWSFRVGGFANRLNTLPHWAMWLVYSVTTFALFWFWPQEGIAFIYFQF